MYFIFMGGCAWARAGRTQLKKVFEPNPSVGLTFQLLEILEYVCGLKLDPALVLGPNPLFEMGSKNKERVTSLLNSSIA